MNSTLSGKRKACFFFFHPELLDHGGIEKQVQLLASELSRRGYRIILFVREVVGGPHNPYATALRKQGIKLVLCRWPPWLVNSVLMVLFGPRAFLSLVDCWRRRRSFLRSWRGIKGRLVELLDDFPVYLNLSWYALRKYPRTLHLFRKDGVLALWWALWWNLPTIYTEPGTPSSRFGKRWQDFGNDLQRVNCVTVQSQAGYGSLRSFLNYQGPIQIIPSMVEDPEEFHFLGKMPPPFVVGYAGRLSPEKGVKFLVECAAIVLSHRSDVCFRVAGDGIERPELESLAEGLGVADSFIWLGRIDSEAIPHFLRQLHVFVLPSLTEGCPVALIEAMSYRKPAIVTRAGGTPELVEEGVTGLVVPPEDPERLAEALLTLLQTPEKLSMMGRAGYQRYHDHYRVDPVVDFYEQTYSIICNRRIN